MRKNYGILKIILINIIFIIGSYFFTNIVFNNLHIFQKFRIFFMLSYLPVVFIEIWCLRNIKFSNIIKNIVDCGAKYNLVEKIK